MTYAGQLAAQFTWEGIERTMKNFDRHMQIAQRSAQSAARNSETAMQRASRAIDSALKFTLKVNGVDTAKQQLSGVEKMVNNLGRSMAIAAGAFATQKVGGFMFDSAKEMERVVFGMQNVFGKDAPKLIKELQDLGAKTPEEFANLADSFTRLNAAGFTFSVGEFGKLVDSAAFSNTKVSEVVQSMISLKRGQLAMVDNIYGQLAQENNGQITLTAQDVKTKQTVVTKNLDKDNIDANAIKDFYLQSAGRNGVAGMAVALSKTLEGKQSTFVDNLKMASNAFYLGFQNEVHTAFNVAIGDVEKFTAKATELGKSVGHFLKADLPHHLQTIQRLAPLAAMGLGVMYARIVGLKVITAAGWIWKGVMAFRALGLAGVMANIAVMAIPIAIGAVVGGIAYLGYEIFKFATTGKGLIADLSAKFPEFGEFVQEVAYLFEEWRPQIMLTLETLKIMAIDGLIWMGEKGIEILRYWIIPAFIAVGQTISDWWNGFVIIRDWFLQALEDWNAGMEGIKTTFTSVMNWLGEKFGWLLELIQKGSDALSNFGSGFSGGGGGGLLPEIMGQYDANFGSKVAKFAKDQAMLMGRFESLGQCAFGVETALAKVGVNMTGHAYQLKAQLDADKRFKLVQVSDEQMRSLPAGAITVHDKNPVNAHLGKGALYGHVEVSLGDGNAASDYVGKQMANHYAGGKRYVYIPVGTQTVQMPTRPQGGPLANPPAAPVTANTPQTFVFNMGLNTSPQSLAQQVGLAAQQGAADGIRNAVTVPTPTRKK